MYFSDGEADLKGRKKPSFIYCMCVFDLGVFARRSSKRMHHVYLLPLTPTYETLELRRMQVC